MADFVGSLAMPPDTRQGLGVEIHLGEGRLRLTAQGKPIGDWPLDEVEVRAKQEGFHLLLEGDEVLLTTTDDAGFALAIGLASAPPRLRRHMAAALRPEHPVERSPKLQPRPPVPPGAELAGT